MAFKRLKDFDSIYSAFKRLKDFWLFYYSAIKRLKDFDRIYIIRIGHLEPKKSDLSCILLLSGDCVAQGNAWRKETRQLKDAYTPPSNSRSRWAPYGPVCLNCDSSCHNLHFHSDLKYSYNVHPHIYSFEMCPCYFDIIFKLTRCLKRKGKDQIKNVLSFADIMAELSIP